MAGNKKPYFANKLNFFFFRFSNGPKPKMPKKEKNRTYDSEESLLRKLSLDNNISLPPGMKGKYTVGKMIGDGKYILTLKNDLNIYVLLTFC